MHKKPNKIIPLKTITQLPPAKRITALATNNDILSQEIALLIKEFRIANSLRQKLISALLTGFATVIGATLLVTLMVYILTQLATIEVLRPLIENVVLMVKTTYR